jgi:hypothetical protein
VSQAPIPRNVALPAWRNLPAALLVLLLAASAQAATGARAAAPQEAAESAEQSQATYDTPNAALAALIAAADARDRTALRGVFGPEYERLLSGDTVQDDNNLERFDANLRLSAQLQENADGTYTILVGKNGWPFPIPIVRQDGRWRFDTQAGLDEILNRKIGRNELSAIATCRAYVIAQWEYYTVSGADHDGLAVYARRFISRPGTRDGLFWPTAPDQTSSPFGDLITARRAEGYGPRGGKRNDWKSDANHEGKSALPYHGYYFRILTRQGRSAPGGKFNYVINGSMIGGYALVAYPAKWGSSGVMTFIVNQQGRVYQKNLGPNTAKLAEGMTEYNPDPTWRLVETEP